MARLHNKPRVQFQFPGPKKKEKKAKKQSGGGSRRDSQSPTTTQEEAGDERCENPKPLELPMRGGFNPACPSVQCSSLTEFVDDSALRTVGEDDDDGYDDSPPASLMIEADDLLVTVDSGGCHRHFKAPDFQVALDSAGSRGKCRAPQSERCEEQRSEREAFDVVLRSATPLMPPHPGQSQASLSPRWNKLVTLFAGRRKSTAAVGKTNVAGTAREHKRRSTDSNGPLQRNANSAVKPLHQITAEDDSVAVPSLTPQPIPTKLLPHTKHPIQRSVPRASHSKKPHHAIVEKHHHVRVVPSAYHHLTGNAVVQPDTYKPEIVQRGGFGAAGGGAGSGIVRSQSGINLYRQNSILDRRGDPWAEYWLHAQKEQFQPKSRGGSEVCLTALRSG